jgi:hypothetical protein
VLGLNEELGDTSEGKRSSVISKLLDSLPNKPKMKAKNKKSPINESKRPRTIKAVLELLLRFVSSV